MTSSGLSAARGGGISSSLLLFIAIIASLSNVLFVRSLPVITEASIVSSTPAVNNSLVNSSLPVTDLFSMNMKMVEFRCKPQDRAYNLMDLLRSNGQLNESEQIRDPSYIVIKRCDSHAGCCSSWKKVCTVATDPSSTSLQIAEVKITQVGRSDKIKKIQIEHHQKCNCTSEQYEKGREAIDAIRPNVKFI